MKFLYLLIDLFTVSVPLLFSFHPKIKFISHRKEIFLSIFPVAIFFLIFDSIFTRHGIWSFNPRYIVGINLFGLPLEEILFFICIPYACVFTYYCLNKFFNLSWNPKAENIFCLLFAAFLLIIGLVNAERIYTSSVFISTAILCIMLRFFFHVRWLGNAVTVYGALLLPFIIVNGILTGTGPAEPVVQYNPAENLGIRLLTIPIEDFVYGFELFLLNLFFFLRQKWGNNSRPVNGAY